MTADKTTYFYPNKTLRLGKVLMDLSTPKIMGILNATPDSFFDGGKYLSAADALQRANVMINEGADIIDVGGMSSRPGAEIIDTEIELRRVLPVLEVLKKNFPDIPLSIDTIHSKVAKEAINIGAEIINDISGGRLDEEIRFVAAENKVCFILMHMHGSPNNMQQEPVYENVCWEVFDFLVKGCNQLLNSGVNQIIIDPGFGFGKNLDHNYKLAAHFDIFKKIGFPVLAGISRKSMICKLLKVNPDKALNGSTVLHTALLLKGADILRVHDVKEAVEVLKIVSEVKRM